MKLLLIIAHPDDEISCAGTVEKLKKEKGTCKIVCFTGNPIRNSELKESCKKLGATFETFNIKENELKIKIHNCYEKLVKIIRDFKPEIIITQDPKDYHPHHRWVYNIAKEAVEFASHDKKGHTTPLFLSMETNNLFHAPDIFVDISEEQKFRNELIKVYSSELQKEHKKNYYIEFCEAKSRLRGVQVGTEPAEAFIVNKQPIHGNFYSKSRVTTNLKQLNTLSLNSSTIQNKE